MHGPPILHTSWRGRFSAALSPIILLGFGVWAYSGRGLDLFSGVLLGLGLVLALAVLWDYPITTVIGPQGICRRCILRKQMLRWEKLDGVVRPKRARLTVTSPGLAAEIRKRPFSLLCDRMESADEFDAVVAALDAWAPSVPIRASRPVDGVPPTWLHKKKLAEIGPDRVDRQTPDS